MDESKCAVFTGNEQVDEMLAKLWEVHFNVYPNEPVKRIRKLAAGIEMADTIEKDGAVLPCAEKPGQWEVEIRNRFAAGADIASVRMWWLREKAQEWGHLSFPDFSRYEQAFFVDLFYAHRLWKEQRQAKANLH